jgi:hypothetical protein
VTVNSNNQSVTTQRNRSPPWHGHQDGLAFESWLQAYEACVQCRQEQDDVRSTAIDACQSSTTASRAFTSIIFLVFFFVIIKKLKLFPISKMVGFCNMSPFFFSFEDIQRLSCSIALKFECHKVL